MTAPPQQQQLTPGDHQYFEWSNRRNYYQYSEDNQLKQNKPISHIKKKQKINGITSYDELNHLPTCYPFQAELTQKIDIECDDRNQTTHPPTHHFTLSTVINVSVNGQTQKSQQQYPIKSHEYLQSTLIPYSELNLSLYLKDIDLTTLDTFILPSCPNPQDYLTVDGLLTFLMSDKQLIQSQMHNQYRYPYQQYPMSQYYDYPQQNPIGPCASETSTSPYYRQSSLPQQMPKYYSTTTSTPSFR
jgi:hypothetical protein